MPKYETVGISAAQKREIKELIWKKEWLGYRSMADFVGEAVRRLIEDCQQRIPPSKEGKDWS